MSRTITYIFAFILMSVIALFSVKGCVNARRDLAAIKTGYVSIQDSADLYRDKYGREHAQKEFLQQDAASAVVFFSSQIDSMAALLKIKPKQVKSIIYVPFQADTNIDSLKQALARTDTLLVPIRDTVEGRIRFNGLMSLTKYDKNIGFLGLKKKQYLDVHFDDPIFKPLNISGFDISDPAMHWSIGPYFGYGWNGDRWAPQVGISIQYSLIKF